MIDLKKVANKDLIDYIASHKVFKVNKDLAKECMIELSSRCKNNEDLENIIKLIDDQVNNLKNIMVKKNNVSI